MNDPLPLAQELLRRPSVTPEDAGAQDVLAGALERLGFAVTRLRFGHVENFVARIGEGSPHIGFAGHTDVVPPGEGWRFDPFGGIVEDGMLYGRGAVDMKGAIAAFAAAAADRLESGPLNGSISLLITGDEEGEAVEGTAKLLEALLAWQALPDFCLVGEPTSVARLGDVVKIGRRGSISARITVRGVQGHVAYPHLADNPVHRLIAALHEMTQARLDEGTPWFQPSSLQVTSIDVGNPAGNVIPASASAALNIRFNDAHSGASLRHWIESVLALHAPEAECAVTVSGEPFRTEPGPAIEAVTGAISRIAGIEPRLDTGGGTSDARFITKFCPVVEFGLIGATMHRVDECVPVAELRELAAIYRETLARAGL